MAYLSFTLVPLQGFFNFLVFISHKVYNYQRVHSDMSRFEALKVIFRGNVEEPLLFSRISLVWNDLEGRVMDIEIVDENGNNEILHIDYESIVLGSESGGQVCIDNESAQDDVDLDGFSVFMEQKSDNENVNKNKEIELTSIEDMANSGLSGFSSALSPKNSIDSGPQFSSLHSRDRVSIDRSNDDASELMTQIP